MNYFEILGMNREPFSTSPDPHFFYDSPEHKAALIRILIEVRLKRGLSVILGDVGTGKTTLCRKLLQLFKERENVEFYIILDPTFKTEDLFIEALIRTFGLNLDKEKSNILDYKQELKNFLFKKGVEQNKTVVLLIDEAQKMDAESLEVLRMLLNYETNDFKLLQLVLVGQMELLPQIKDLRNFVDRISLKYMLNPFDIQEVKSMINFRIQKAGFPETKELFSDDAIEEIYKNTQGYPRRVSMLCHNALRELVITDHTLVTKEIIQGLVSKEVLI
ncbi:MAG: AAA family ATPase [Candidatus Omnitrophica bacterium]|nr:AAA family ATPase [Candidatus Omnitrophota bacterium]